MLKLIIQHPTGETVINNVEDTDLAFWQELLASAFCQGQVQVVPVDDPNPQAA